MNALAPEAFDVLTRLKAALSAKAIPAREAESCARLVDRLTRPVRVGVFGLSTGGDDWLLSRILGKGVLPDGPEWPTLEVVSGPKVLTHGTFETGATETHEGPADAAFLAAEPVFLRIEAPAPALERMSFLYLATDDTATEQLAALDWAEPRTDIAIWTTSDYSAEETELWARAPDRLKNHALLVATDDSQSEATLTARAGFEFDGVFSVPRNGVGRTAVDRLMARLDADIAEARAADIDAAQMFLHRLGHLVQTVPSSGMRRKGAAATGAAPSRLAFSEAPAARFDPAKPASQAEAKPEKKSGMSPEQVGLLSEPLLYLRRRARALLEMLEWRAAEDGAASDESWAGDVLEHCCETTEALQSRAMYWPEDDTRALSLRRTLDEACDVAVLLQVEGGPEQAQDAAMMLLQLRGDFERGMAA